MTYQGLFEKCNTLVEARELKNKLLAKAPDDLRNLAVLSIEHAYKKRREDLRNEVSVANQNDNRSCDIPST